MRTRKNKIRRKIYKGGTLTRSKVEFNEDYCQPQESLGCGRHALNNLLGGTYFVKEGQPITDENINTFDGTTKKISLQEVCKYLAGTKRTSERFDCPEDENYIDEVLSVGLGLIGYSAVAYIKNESSYVLNKDFIGFIVNVPGHWIALRKDGENYIKVDSLACGENEVLSLDDIDKKLGKTYNSVLGVIFTGKYMAPGVLFNSDSIIPTNYGTNNSTTNPLVRNVVPRSILHKNTNKRRNKVLSWTTNLRNSNKNTRKTIKPMTSQRAKNIGWSNENINARKRSNESEIKLQGENRKYNLDLKSEELNFKNKGMESSKSRRATLKELSSSNNLFLPYKNSDLEYLPGSTDLLLPPTTPLPNVPEAPTKPLPNVPEAPTTLLPLKKPLPSRKNLAQQRKQTQPNHYTRLMRNIRTAIPKKTNRLSNMRQRLNKSRKNRENRENEYEDNNIYEEINLSQFNKNNVAEAQRLKGSNDEALTYLQQIETDVKDMVSQGIKENRARIALELKGNKANAINWIKKRNRNNSV